MSLLLQALQKASKNRGTAENEPTVDLLDSDELTLEPLGVVEPGSQRETASASPTPAQAAAVLQASRAPAFDPLDYAREHYMIVFIVVAILFAIGYGTYVYLQVANPAWLRSKPSAAPMAPLTAPAPAAPVAAAAPESAAAKVSGMPADIETTVAPSRPAITEPQPASAPMFDEPASTDAAKAAIADTKPARAVASRSRREAEPAVRQADEDGVENVVIESTRSSATAARREVAAAAAPSVNPELMQAYEALQNGDTAQAKTLYSQVLRTDPGSIDALLGLGAIAWKDGRADEAALHYQGVLELEPRNAYAQAGLISIIGGADPQASETRLRQLIAREPSAFLYFSLGNLYADQGQWPAAQQAYFQAYQSQPDNPDYAFNLAVGLEHLGQTRPALDYYRKALDLSFRKGRANFDQSLVIQRVGQLSSRVEQ